MYDLPPELLLSIFREIESDEDLLTLAATSTRFNHLSLQVFFTNHNFDPNSKAVMLHGYDGLTKLSALAMSLSIRGTSLDHLTLDFGCIHNLELLLYKTRIITKYINNLSTIGHVTFRIVIPPFPVITEWRAASITLLDTVMGKSCSNLDIETKRCGSGIANETIHKDKLTLYKTSFISKTSGWFRMPWSPGRQSKTGNKSNEATKHLKECFVRSFPPFFRPFYLRTLKANASVLTDLSFQSIISPKSAIDWGFLITNLHLPVLKRFAITHSIIPLHPIVKFLSKHSYITGFEYHHIDYSPKPRDAPCRLEVGLYHLEQLTTTPGHIVRFLPPLDLMSITSITIIIEANLMYNYLGAALRCLSFCIKKVELTLYISVYIAGLRVWPIKLVRQPLLRCVESLCLQNEEFEWGYTEPTLLHLLTLLRLFPELRHLTLHSYLSSVVEPNTLFPFFEQAKLVCPIIASISMRGSSEWTHKYPSCYDSDD